MLVSPWKDRQNQPNNIVLPKVLIRRYNPANYIVLAKYWSDRTSSICIELSGGYRSQLTGGQNKHNLSLIIYDECLYVFLFLELESVEDFELSFEKTDIANMMIPIIHQQRNFMIIYLYLKDFISFCLISTPKSQMIDSERSVS